MLDIERNENILATRTVAVSKAVYLLKQKSQIYVWDFCFATVRPPGLEPGTISLKGSRSTD